MNEIDIVIGDKTRKINIEVARAKYFPLLNMLSSNLEPKYGVPGWLDIAADIIGCLNDLGYFEDDIPVAILLQTLPVMIDTLPSPTQLLSILRMQYSVIKQVAPSYTHPLGE